MDDFHAEISILYFICYHRVVEVTPREVVLKDKATKEITKLPYGMCVWSTGVAPQDITKKLIAKLPQQRNA